MEPGTIVALVGIGVLFFLILLIWFMVENSHKHVKADIKYATGAAFAFSQQITDVFLAYAEYMMSKNDENRAKMIAKLDEWMTIMSQLIEPAEVSKLRAYLTEKLDVEQLEATIKINQEIIADIQYPSKNAKQAILSTMNNLDNYLYSNNYEAKNNAKTTLLAYQAGTSFAISLSHVVV